jgi:hypothetical protein
VATAATPMEVATLEMVATVATASDRRKNTNEMIIVIQKKS